MDFLRMNRWIGWLLVIIGGVIIAGSCFDSGVTDLDDTRITTKVCSDYPQNAQPADCVTSREVLDENDAIDNWPLFIGGLLLLASGLAVVTGTGPFKRAESDVVLDRDRKPTSSYLLTPLLFMQQIDASSPTCEGWWDCYRGVSIGLLLLVAGLIAYFLWRGRKKDTAARTARYGGS